MRLVLDEYLSSLKEDGELDVFITQLLSNMGFVSMSKIQRGRQYGVDLAMIGTDEIDHARKLYLFVVKQGNFSRQIWDNGHVNDIRPSINEILDVYLKTHVPKPFNQLPVKVIVCTNGELEQTVQVNWAQFVNNNTTGSIEITFWGINVLIDLALRYQLQEELFPKHLMLNFRRSLSFFDLPDYDFSHFNSFLNALLPQSEPKILSEKQVLKKIRLVNLCMSIVHEWCKNSNNLKPSYIAGERIILTTYNWILANNLMEHKKTWITFYSVLENWRKNNNAYIEKVYKYALVKDGLSFGVPSPHEYSLITYEQIGIISMMGLFELWICSIGLQHSDTVVFQLSSKPAFEAATGMANLVAHLINNNPSSLNPKFDEHCIEINLAMLLLYETGLFGSSIPWLRNLIDRVIVNIQMINFLPLINSDVSKISSTLAKEQTTNHLLVVLAEWCLIFKQINYYQKLRQFIQLQLPNLNLQLWFPDKYTEDFLYKECASFETGSTMTSIKLPENPLILEMNIKEEQVLINEEKSFKCFDQMLGFMPHLAIRHFRTYPFPNSWRSYLNSRFCFSPSQQMDEETSPRLYHF